ncbi:type II toxin -antitoxin system TacA 1-like antitoxin [Gordonia soli]|uniref:Arc-like DNA binding domain-containing protein n=1 Tax=Gordonia soli NBRC 108243 TaxID=1223545 RepID=M0QFM8_9ACTN|nr:DUF1778 domain-containing protein [Gordonia soli]GAC67269.1 hypothetical protein GS4_07_00180 [Gordonia soli NBRC 108243]
MDVSRYVNNLGTEIAALADVGGAESRELVERLTGPIESAIRVTVLDVLSAAADEITRDLAPGSVEVRLRGREPQFVVSLPAAHAAPETDEPRPADPTPDSADLLTGEDGPAARINLRLPEQLKAAIEDAAAAEGRSVNAWLVRAGAAALQRPTAEDTSSTRREHRSSTRLTGWVR